MGLGVYLEVTNACNLRCVTCLPASAQARHGELGAEEVARILERLKDAGASTAFFTGGEPFFRPDFPAILSHAAGLGYACEVVTNATVCNREILDLLVKHGVRVHASLDGAEAGTNDPIRGEGIFDRAVRGISRFVEAGVRVSMSFTVTRQSFSQIEDVARLARGLGCDKITYSEIVRGGRAASNWSDLELREAQSRELPEQVEKAAAVFGDDGVGMDDRCWVDGSSVFVDSTGRAYACSEIFQQAPTEWLADLRSEVGMDLLLSRLAERHTHRPCCYEVRASEHVTLIRNLPRSCALVGLARERSRRGIGDLPTLKSEIDRMWKGIERSCAKCSDPDCLGYVWVLPEEEGELHEAGVTTVQLNGTDGPLFIDSYERDESGALVVTKMKPDCPYRAADGTCSVHHARPLVCHLYPLGPETERDGRIVWALHTDCHHIRSLAEAGLLEAQIRRIQAVLARIEPGLRRRLLEIYRGVDAVSAMPDGSNEYLVIQDL